MGELLQPWHLMVLFFVFGLFFLPTIFYILTLQKALNKCSVGSRTMQPGTMWLLLIPVFSLIWSFFVVSGVAHSLGNEFRARNIIAEPEPAKSLGMAMCICAACGIIPVLGLLTSLVGLVLWIMYWSKIAGYSRQLDIVPYMGTTPNAAPGV